MKAWSDSIGATNEGGGLNERRRSSGGRSTGETTVRKMMRVENHEVALRYQVDENGQIDRFTVIGGSLRTLVEHLADEHMPDTVYIDSFLLTFRHIVTPAQLMDQLTVRYSVVPPPNVACTNPLF